jgi:hypothetical protein
VTSATTPSLGSLLAFPAGPDRRLDVPGSRFAERPRLAAALRRALPRLPTAKDSRTSIMVTAESSSALPPTSRAVAEKNIGLLSVVSARIVARQSGRPLNLAIDWPHDAGRI